jgi:hypothetical protein
MTRTYLVVGILIVSTVVCPTGSLQAQRADRGVITGIVTDQTGSAIAGANVKIRNEGTGVETVLTTNGAVPIPLRYSYSVATRS